MGEIKNWVIKDMESENLLKDAGVTTEEENEKQLIYLNFINQGNK